MNMMWLQVSACFLAVSVLLTPSLAAVCPDSCVCATTRDGLHRATCSNLAELYKFTLRQKHHNINILDLSHNNITKLNHELDRLTEVVTLDLSTNGIQHLSKFLHNAKKLVHLNLSNNRLQHLALTYLPKSVSSLDISNNLLKGVPYDLAHLTSLEHLEMEGNPLDCSCENLMARDRLLVANVFIDNVKCVSPAKYTGKSWLELKTKDICKSPKDEIFALDMMMGDQPNDALQVGEDTTALKSMPSAVSNDLNDGNVIVPSVIEDDDIQQFLKVEHSTSSPSSNDIEGSGEYESTTISEFYIEPRIVPQHHENLMSTDEIIPVDNVQTTEDPLEGSGEGSGFLSSDYDLGTDEKTTTEAFVEINIGPIVKLIEDDANKSSTTEFPLPNPPSVYKGGADWNSENVPLVTTEPSTTSTTQRDTTVSEQIRVTQASEVLGQKPAAEETAAPHKTGTYVCIAIIVVLLVGLIGFAIIKGQMRKRRDRRLLRQQKRDVEKASKEMVDMNKSLLGKAAPLEEPVEKKVNGKYELVPTHEIHSKKVENNGVSNGINPEPNTTRTDSPRDSNQNKSSSRDNNLMEHDIPQQDSSFESAASPDLRKDSNSLASEEIFVPIDDDSKPNGGVHQPLINGDQNTDSDFLSPSQEYVPVYSPDMGRVRIKMSETPKPKTPVLVTRSRSNAGDIIITPSENGNTRNSTT